MSNLFSVITALTDSADTCVGKLFWNIAEESAAVCLFFFFLIFFNHQVNATKKIRRIPYKNSVKWNIRQTLAFGKYKIIYLLISLKWIGGEAIIFGFKNLPQSSFKPIIAENIEDFYANSFYILSDMSCCVVSLKEGTGVVLLSM